MTVFGVIAMGVAAPGHWFGETVDAAALVGTFMPEKAPEKPVRTVDYLISDYAVRLMPDARAEVKVDGDFVPAYYRVERNRVLVETADADGGNRAWAFEIDGDRLLEGSVVLCRAED